MELKRIFDCLYYQWENHPLDTCLARKYKGKWVYYNTNEAVEIVNNLSFALLGKEIQPGDKVGIVSYNRPEWVFCDYAISQIGGINVPMYPNSTPGNYQFIIEHAEVKLIFAGDADIYQKLKEATASMVSPPLLFTFERISNVPHWRDLLVQCTPGGLEEIKRRQENIKGEDLATIIYTSGTTGEPKGVMLSHSNILSSATSVIKVIPPIEPGMKTLSFLPLSHIFERTGLYAYMHSGVSIYYAESMDTIAENLKEVKPHFFATVPRLLEKVYDKILKTGYELKGIKKQLFFWALHLGQRYVPHEKQSWWYAVQLKWANKLIFSKWREALGGNIYFIVSAGAALQPRLATIFWAAQIRILEAYGLTETSPGVTFSKYDDIRIGSVGPLLDQVQLRIADDGEVLVKGPNVMMGYYKRPDLTNKVINADGWFHTGDIGEMVEDVFLKITDRKKEIFKTSGGKYIAPQLLENKLKESLLIEQVMVVGEGQKFPAALIVPSFEALRDWCALHDIKYTTDQEMVTKQEIITKFRMEVDQLNTGFAQYQKVKKIRLLAKPWTVEDGELTAKLSMKRRVILERSKPLIDDIYQ